MAIDNVLLTNPKLIHGMSKSSSIPTQIVSNGNTEYRMRTNAFERFTWQWPASTMTDAQLRELYKFWVERDGGLKAFKFQDPDYPNFVSGKLSSAGGTKWYLRIPFDSSTAGLHRIFNLTIGSMTCTKNGSPATIASAQIETNGEPTITVTGSSSGDTIRISGPCYFSARFDSNVSWSLTGLDENNLPVLSTYDTIRLVEVFETTL